MGVNPGRRRCNSLIRQRFRPRDSLSLIDPAPAEPRPQGRRLGRKTSSMASQPRRTTAPERVTRTAFRGTRRHLFRARRWDLRRSCPECLPFIRPWVHQSDRRSHLSMARHPEVPERQSRGAKHTPMTAPNNEGRPGEQHALQQNGRVGGRPRTTLPEDRQPFRLEPHMLLLVFQDALTDRSQGR